MQRLELMLREPGVEQLDVTWKKHGLEVVSNLLNQGKALKERMKLSVLVSSSRNPRKLLSGLQFVSRN